MLSGRNEIHLDKPHPFPGKLIVVEGIDGSGKSTQLQLAHRWLESIGHTVFFTEWNSADLVKAVTKKGKKKMVLTPTTFCLLHATDFAHRLVYSIIPPLKAGMIVLADRYVFTAFGRDVVRGCDPKWVRKVYRFAVKPDLAFYFRVPIDTAIDRIVNSRAAIKTYEAGMDMGLSNDTVESFGIFQGRILREYAKMVDEYGLTVVDAAKSITEQQRVVRQAIDNVLEDYKKPRAVAI
ncbi:MAG: thymidylate kinase [Phycisphaerae bacterium]|nr:thymidylate kinase [Phycisphaerae bacterium]